MARPTRDLTIPETAMRVMLMVQQAERTNPHFVMRDVVTKICETLDMSRCNAYRLVRFAVDMLGIAYDSDPVRLSARRARVAGGIHAA